MYLIADPVVRYLLIGSLPLLLLLAWLSFRAQISGLGPLSSLMARLRDDSIRTNHPE